MTIGGDLASKLAEIFVRRSGNGNNRISEDQSQIMKDRIIVRTAIGTFDPKANNQFALSELENVLEDLKKL